MFGRTRELAKEAIAASKSNSERQDRHEDGCTETWKEVKETITEVRQENTSARTRTEAMHKENQAAIGRLNNRIFALLLAVAGSIILVLLSALGTVIWRLATNHGSL